MNLAARIASWTRLVAGLACFMASGRTPAVAYQAMIRLFCASGGRSNDQLSSWLGRIQPPRPLAAPIGVLGDLSGERLRGIVDALRRDGYYVFPDSLPLDMCDRLRDFGLRQPSVIREGDGPTPDAGKSCAYGDDRAAPRGVRYELPVADLLANHDVQRLLCDASILNLAQDYLGAMPVADVLSMWWHTGFADSPSAAAAQFYHFDMDRIKWLKIFIYLTDVRPENGPHSFIAGSHRTGGIPPALLSQGYARLSDEQVAEHYRARDIIEFTGSKGTIIVEDTRGLHKGRHVEAGDRLMLQLQFSNSLFGGFYPKSALPGERTPVLQQAIDAHAGIYRNFL